MKIWRCVNKHYSYGDIEQLKICPWCGEKFEKIYEHQEGDCVACGQLCPSYAYGCSKPQPIITENHINLNEQSDFD